MATEQESASGETTDHQAQLKSLVAELSDSNGRKRQKARETLVFMGRAAVPVLVEALQSPDQRLRWEAAKALGEIAHPSTIDALLAAMMDDEPEIRWLAAEAMAAIGWPAVEPLLRALVHSADRTLFRMGAHFVLRTIVDRGTSEILQPVVDALEGVEPSLRAPIAAQEALIRLLERRLNAA